VGSYIERSRPGPPWRSIPQMKIELVRPSLKRPLDLGLPLVTADPLLDPGSTEAGVTLIGG
jgi:hypothetical protein